MSVDPQPRIRRTVTAEKIKSWFGHDPEEMSQHVLNQLEIPYLDQERHLPYRNPQGINPRDIIVSPITEARAMKGAELERVRAFMVSPEHPSAGADDDEDGLLPDDGPPATRKHERRGGRRAARAGGNVEHTF